MSSAFCAGAPVKSLSDPVFKAGGKLKKLATGGLIS